MAVGRILLAAEQCDAEPLHPVEQPIDALEEERTLRETPVEDVPFPVVELLSLRPTSELPTEEQVPDPGLLRRALEGGPVEVRRVGRPRHGADVHEHLNRVGPEEVHEHVERVVRMADREQAPPDSWLA